MVACKFNHILLYLDAGLQLSSSELSLPLGVSGAALML